MPDMFSMDDLVKAIVTGGGPRLISKVVTSMEGLGQFFHSTWYDTGNPGVGAAPSSGINGGAITSDPTMVTGQIPFVKAAAGNVKRLALFEGCSDQAGSMHLF